MKFVKFIDLVRYLFDVYEFLVMPFRMEGLYWLRMLKFKIPVQRLLPVAA